MPVTVVQPGFFNRGKSEGAGGGGSHDRKIFENLGMKTAFSCTLNVDYYEV